MIDRLYILNGLKIKLNNSCDSIFKPFENPDFLTDKQCIEITGWSKKIFLKFASLITSINETEKRSKESLLAIYRYWLRKGVDQQTLGFLNNSSQSTMSNYLAQIRKAIYQDFVSLYLGARSRTREFFCSRNTKTCRKLHKLQDDDLALIADGTYIRCEKSRNIPFQYNSYSKQKLDNLLKPFLLICPDGYIVDCYGPFRANLNDADIFKFIIYNDQDLRNILVPKKTILFLDRGFRDIYNYLKLRQLRPLIPYCKQLKKCKQTTYQQKGVDTSKSRMITKVRKTRSLGIRTKLFIEFISISLN